MMEEQSEYDQEALQFLNEIFVKREKEKQELEKELELCRRRLLSGTSLSSSLNGNSEDVFTDPNAIDEQFEPQESNQNTPSVSIMSTVRGYGDAIKRISWDESLVNFEEEKISILEQKKFLEEKLQSFAKDDQAGMAHLDANVIEDDMEQLKVLEEKLHTFENDGQARMAHLDTNVIEDNMKGADVDKETL
ncbi:hypothetical protein KI387_030649, partial [Taxus chinensis]